MIPKTKAEVFIQTLEEMRDEERQRQEAGLRRKLKAQVERFLKKVRTDRNDSRPPAEWIR